MRFKKFLIENKGDLVLVDIIRKDCKPFIDELKKYKGNETLYRGVDELRGWCLQKRRRQDRKPLNTPASMQEFFDEVFYDKFGWRPRSTGVFASSNYTEVKNYYGWKPYVFLPVGPLDFIWSKEVNDLFFDSPNKIEWNKAADKEPLKEEIRELLDTYRSDNLSLAIDTKNEIMFNCDYYWLIDDEKLHTRRNSQARCRYYQWDNQRFQRSNRKGYGSL
jgi:hypothetical protein